jgi:pimeloyl-ACP methyl ester carboxylesterase
MGPQVIGTVERVSARGLHYTIRGDGPGVVCLHGWCLSGRLWLHLEEDLAHDHLVVCPDLPGFGRSARLAGPYDLPRLAADVADLLDELGLDAAVMVGFAFGACVAMQLAASQPARVGGVVLIGVPSASTAPYGRMPKAMRHDWPLFARRSAVAICKQPQSEATLAYLERMFVGTPLPVAIETVGVLEHFEPLELAPKVNTPALLVHGRDDDVVPLSVAEGCGAAMPSARLAVVEDSGHLVPFDQKSALVGLVRDFLAERS